MWIGDHARRIEEVLEPDAIAGGAGARGTVEREHLGLERRHAVTAFGAGLARGEQRFILGFSHFLGIVGREARHATGELQCRFERFGQALLRVGADPESVYHDLDGVFLLRIDLGQRIELVHAAVDAHAHEALAAHGVEDLRVFALAVDDHRCEQQDGEAVRHPQDLVDHLAHGLRLERHAVVRATRDAGAREQQAQIVVDLRDRADGGARVVRGRLLLDRDRGRKTFDAVDVGLVHHREELARIRGERFHVAALAFRIQRVERKRALARSRQARDHDELVAREVDVDVLEVVRAGAADFDGLHLSSAKVGANQEKPRSLSGEAGPRITSACSGSGLYAHRMPNRISDLSL